MSEHPQLKNMEAAIRKQEVSLQKIKEFEKWMNGKKFKEEYKAEAEKLLCEAKSLYESGSGDAGYQNLNRNAADASALGAPFHNPYTFIPFPDTPPERKTPTPLTIDEIEKDRMTGVLTIRLQTHSPLLVPAPAMPQKQNEQNSPNEVRALRIGKDIVVPASSIRGVLRTLTAIISGSALDYVDDELWLCQGRDKKLENSEKKYFLAEILRPGDRYQDGEVKVGEATLVETRALQIDDKDRYDYVKNKKQLWIAPPNPHKSEKRGGGVSAMGDGHVDPNPHKSEKRDERHPFRVKVSGRKVNQHGIQHEGAFRPDQAREITLGKQLWMEYSGRHRNAEKKELRKGDLVWLEASNPEHGIRNGSDVLSIQWARWGRGGVNFMKDCLKGKLKDMLPDSIRNDGMVDITSDLFGCVPLPGNGKKSFLPFAARIRPENLVFETPVTFWNNMPPRSAPHPGCKAFYMANDDYDEISLKDLPRGYKVYRTSRHDRDEDAPWKYENQPIFDDRNTPKPFRNAAKNTTRNELLQAASTGTLRIAYRALTRKEFALLLLVLSCDLRIGGGKPFGLGHCTTMEIHACHESGEPFLDWIPEKAQLPPEFASELPPAYLERAELYCRTQIPVPMLRYPRAVNRRQRGGMSWFGYFTSPKKDSEKGLEPLGARETLSVKAGGKTLIRAQGLPVFNPDDPQSDLLFGYDLEGVEPERKNAGKNYYSDFKEVSGAYDGPKYRNISPNKETRRQERSNR